MDKDGAVVARYTYSAWGEKRSVTDADGGAITGASHIANINPLRYRGYYYDTETGFYYLQSRYYDPVTHRFINADTYSSTDSANALASNMFAYCQNSPIMHSDPSGKLVVPFIPVKDSCAIELLDIWLTGDGSYQSFGEGSSLAVAFEHSATMNSILDRCVEEYKASGKSYFESEGYISGYSEFDLWMAVRSFHYEITVSTERKTRGFWFFKEEYIGYKLDVKITDKYNFNSNTDSGDGLGSFLNNFAYNLHQRGYGCDYEWEVKYSTYDTTRRIHSGFRVPCFIM